MHLKKKNAYEMLYNVYHLMLYVQGDEVPAQMELSPTAPVLVRSS